MKILKIYISMKEYSEDSYKAMEQELKWLSDKTKIK